MNTRLKLFKDRINTIPLSEFPKEYEYFELNNRSTLFDIVILSNVTKESFKLMKHSLTEINKIAPICFHGHRGGLMNTEFVNHLYYSTGTDQFFFINGTEHLPDLINYLNFGFSRMDYLRMLDKYDLPGFTADELKLVKDGLMRDFMASDVYHLELRDNKIFVEYNGAMGCDSELLEINDFINQNLLNNKDLSLKLRYRILKHIMTNQSDLLLKRDY